MPAVQRARRRHRPRRGHDHGRPPGRRGGGWAVSGHKLWTSAAHYADWGILLARTDWDVPKHQGCTYFLVDMRAPGVTTRPLRQMTGGAAFNEVFLDDVPVADAQRVGAEGDGWSVAVTTLLAERLNLGLGLARVGGGIRRMLSDLRPHGVADDPVVRQLAARLWTDAKVLELLGERIVSKLARGEVPGAEGSVARLASIRVSRRSDELLDAMRGAGGMLVDEYTLLQLWIPATRIAGGTEEALRSIVAERVLGLPREPRADKDVPFRDVPVGRVGEAPGYWAPEGSTAGRFAGVSRRRFLPVLLLALALTAAACSDSKSRTATPRRPSRPTRRRRTCSRPSGPSPPRARWTPTCRRRSRSTATRWRRPRPSPRTTWG